MRQKLEHLADILVKYRKEREKFISATVEWSSSDHDGDALVFSHQVLPLLVAMLDDPDSGISVSSMQALQRIIEKSNKDYISCLLELKSVEVLCNILEREDPLPINQDQEPVNCFLREALAATILSEILKIKSSHESEYFLDIKRISDTALRCLRSENEDIRHGGLSILESLVHVDAAFLSENEMSNICDTITVAFDLHQSFQMAILSFVNLFIIKIPSAAENLGWILLPKSIDALSCANPDDERGLCVLLDNIYLNFSFCNKEYDLEEMTISIICQFMQCESSSCQIASYRLLSKLAESDAKPVEAIANDSILLETVMNSSNLLDNQDLMIHSLHILGRVCRHSREFSEKLICLGCTRIFSIALVHGSDATVKKMAAWCIGQAGCKSPEAAKIVTEQGGLLAIIKSQSFDESDDELSHTCKEAAINVISSLEYLDALTALLKIDICIHIKKALFERLCKILVGSPSSRLEFVQSGGLEAFFQLGETEQSLSRYIQEISNLYPTEIVDRCSPEYMRRLLEKFKRESLSAEDRVDNE